MDSGPDDGRHGTAEPVFRGSRPAGSAARRVLFVDDEPGAAALAATHVERLVDDVQTVARTNPSDALEVVHAERVDCVVSDFDMPGSNGLELLADVREVDHGMPFVLFTGKGSEEIASEAISAGVTDYLQKGTGRDRYEMLANSVANALDRRRAEQDLCEVNEKVTAIHTFATDVSDATDVSEVFERLVDAAEDILRFDRCVSVRRRGDQLVPAALSENVGEDEVRTFDLGEGAVGTTAVEGQTMVIDSISVDPTDPDQLEGPDTVGQPRSETANAADNAVTDADSDLDGTRSDTERVDGTRSDTERVDGTRSDTERVDGTGVADPVADNFQSAISVPVGSHGVFQAVSDGYAAFDERDVEFAELLAAHASDAIEQIETEESLRTERDRLAALFDDVPLPVVRTVDDDGGKRRIDATNDAFEATFGYSADEHTYEEVGDAIIPDDAKRLSRSTIVEKNEPLRVEARRDTVDGRRDFILSFIPVKRSETTTVYNVYADIDDQKRMERTLRRLHETTREMFRGSEREEIAALAARAAIDTLGFPNSAVRLYDDAEGLLLPTAMSDEATASLGERPAFGPEDGHVWEAFETGELVVVNDLNTVDTVVGYGDLRSLLVVPLGDHGVMPLGSKEPHFFDDTAVELARVLGANVTVALGHAKRTEQLRERDADLQREIDRLEKFTGLVSHDLRNPLNVAAGRLELARGFVDDETVLSELDRVEGAHDRMEQLIDDLLALARQGHTVDNIETVDLADAAKRAWRTVDTAAATLETSSEGATVNADPERLRTLLENLFTNSVEHSSTSSRASPDDSVEHGRSRDGVEHGRSRDGVEHGGTDGASEVEIEEAPGVAVAVGSLPDGFYVADDGAGFDIDPAEAIEYGTSVDPGGTGFGLAIVREIATAHGWTLSIDDADGARFEFRTDD